MALFFIVKKTGIIMKTGSQMLCQSRQPKDQLPVRSAELPGIPPGAAATRPGLQIPRLGFHPLMCRAITLLYHILQTGLAAGVLKIVLVMVT